jgi:hypothetical protein
MEETLGSVNVKGHRKKHNFKLEKFSMGGVSYYTLTKNGNIILRCTPKEFVKFKLLFLRT